MTCTLLLEGVAVKRIVKIYILSGGPTDPDLPCSILKVNPASASLSGKFIDHHDASSFMLCCVFQTLKLCILQKCLNYAGLQRNGFSFSYK